MSVSSLIDPSTGKISPLFFPPFPVPPPPSLPSGGTGPTVGSSIPSSFSFTLALPTPYPIGTKMLITAALNFILTPSTAFTGPDLNGIGFNFRYQSGTQTHPLPSPTSFTDGTVPLTFQWGEIVGSGPPSSSTSQSYSITNSTVVTSDGSSEYTVDVTAGSTNHIYSIQCDIGQVTITPIN